MMTDPPSPGAPPTYPEAEDVGQDLGIPAIGKAPWGTHFCQFFGGRQDLLDFLIPFFRTGLEQNEACLLTTTDPLDVDEAIRIMGREIEGFAAALERGQMVVASPETRYLSSGTFDPGRILQAVPGGVTEALNHGYAGRRACTNENWMREDDWAPMMFLESELNAILHGRRSISMCAYPLPKCNASQLVELLKRHHFALIRADDWTLIEPSERKRATEAVERMNLALEERTAQLRTALGDLRGFSEWVTHDLRAPLRSVRGFSELLAETVLPKMDEEELRLFDRIRTSAQHMDDLITDILAYSTAQRGQLRWGPVDLERLTQEAWQSVVATATASPVQLQVRPLPAAYADRSMLRQVLTNLLGNAVKFTAGRPDGLVEVGACTVNGARTYYVRDNGIGFDPAQAERIFQAFERLHGQARYEGTGLGLAIVRKIIVRHGGRVWADGTPGAGATFFFTLPDPRPSQTVG